MREHYLLGGSDLEMQTIEALLEREGMHYSSRSLTWGAKLSAYANVFNDEEHFVGIELIEDIALPKHYTRIDHHGALSHLSSSLEQIAKRLHVSLSREERLIAANDRGYIDAMRCEGASDEEIKDIRARDRAAQGVSAEEEQRAVEELQSLTCKEGVYLLRTTLTHFSPLLDRISKRPLILYRDDALTYYGHKVAALKEHFTCNDHECYFGGNPLGYFGLTQEYFKTHDLDQTIEEIMAVHQEETLYSYHTFMFPFAFKTAKPDKAQWCYRPFTIEAHTDYSEYMYFYPFVRDALFNDAQLPQDNDVSHYYEHQIQSGTYDIAHNGKEFTLELTGVSLRLFPNAHVGILSLNLENRTYFDINDILMINDRGRRIYPQYLGPDLILSPKRTTMPDRITLKLGAYEASEDFAYFKDLHSVSEKPIFLPNYFAHLLKGIEEPKAIIDDRMFVLSMILSDVYSAQMAQWSEATGRYCYEESDLWYKMAFVDSGMKTCQSRHMTSELIRQSTYDRWVGYGTLFGISRYSFVCLTSSPQTLKRHNAEFLIDHMKTMYFQMCTLLLSYRAGIVAFSHRVTQAVEQNENKNQKGDKALQELYRSYLSFMNKHFFREVTAQEQGIELYNKAMQIMQIEKNIKDLDEEIAEIHTLMQMKGEEKRNDKLAKLSEMGALFLPASLIAGIMGMNVLPEWLSGDYWLVYTALIFLGMYRANKFVIQENGIDEVILDKYFAFEKTKITNKEEK